ncbi:hypothetical protein [Ligilactobacillus murinus]|uniref:hypothetical protein n=1 Tax=Ligilactobacillus murinus TaxID=1622 RepID=UPI00351454DC
MRELFPFNYFYAQLSPKKMFAGRHTLNWAQMLLVLLFLLALNLLAIPFYFQKQTTVELKNYLPQVTELLQDKKLQQVAHQTPFRNGSYSFTKKEIIFEKQNKLIALDETTTTAKKYAVAIILQPRSFIFHEGSQTYRIFYQRSFPPNKGDIANQLTKSWYQQNKAALTFSMMALVLTIMLVTDLIFILGGAFFLWLTRNSPLTDITTFKEATNLMLNILGPASLLSAFLGFISFNIASLMLLQTFVLALLFILVYAQTHFKDQ